jgi:hypothetical protein
MPGNATLLATALLVLAACGAPADRAIPGIEPPREIDSPAGARSGEPFLAPSADGGVWLSWIERPDSLHELRVAKLDGDVWTEPRTIARSASFFVNWADFPSVFELPDGRLAAHWLARSGPGRYTYDVRLAESSDGGISWSDPILPHRDGTETEHGFATLFAMHDGSLGAVWLDGREMARRANHGGDHANGYNAAMTLRFTTLGANGSLGEEMLVDDRTCDCCQTDVAVSAEAPLLVYRDRSTEEVRDIVISRFIDGQWSEPRPVHEDGWVIPACPVNGPSIVARDRAAVVAWYTAARDTARVLVAFSTDAGASFAAPFRIDDGDPLGRVDALLLEDGSALVSWLERTAAGAQVRVRRVDRFGAMSAPTTVAASSAERASGFPRMTSAGARIIFAWTQPGEPARVHVAVTPVPRTE